MSDYVLETKDLKKYFDVKGKGKLHAVDGVNLKIKRGRTLGLVGESGCGKSTVGNVIMGLHDITGGNIFFEGKDISKLHGKPRKKIYRKMQIIFQDPYSSINPKKTIKQILYEPYIIQKTAKGKEIESKLEVILNQTGISRDLLYKYPHELDGGKRQTVGIARALALNPELIVCDEPVSALDVSIQAKIINLLMNLQEEFNLTYLFISHDLSVVKHISDDISVMYLGKIVEHTSSDGIFKNPLHPHTKALLSAIPTTKIGVKRKRIILEGDVPSPINPEPGCRFCSRCWLSKEICKKAEPKLTEVEKNHFVACHFVK